MPQTTIHNLTAEQEKRIDEKFGAATTAYDQFTLARAKYIAVCRLNEIDDNQIAREVGVNFTDGGLHVKQIRKAFGIA